MSGGRLHVARGEDGVLTLTLDNPAHRNALNDDLIAALTGALREAAADPACRAVVLRGAGGMFCAGRELNDVVGLQDAGTEAVEAAYQAVWNLNQALYYLPRPTVAVVERFALGAGAGLVNWADIAIAEDGALLGYPEVRIGFPPTLTAVSLIRTIGRKAAMDLLLTGRNVTAEEAMRMGLVSRVVPRGEADAALAETLRLLLAAGPEAIARTKRVVWKIEDAEYRAACAAAVDSISLAVTTHEAREGVAAFVEKRPPRW